MPSSYRPQPAHPPSANLPNKHHSSRPHLHHQAPLPLQAAQHSSRSSQRALDSSKQKHLHNQAPAVQQQQHQTLARVLWLRQMRWCHPLTAAAAVAAVATP